MNQRFAVGLAIVAVVLVAGCSSEPEPEPESVAVSRDAICSGGGGGNDECVDFTGYCPPSCGICFNSIQQKVELRNRWSCEDQGGGGGSGGGRCASGSGCSNAEISSLQSQCRASCRELDPQNTSNGIHECHMIFQDERNRMVAGTCDCASGHDYYAQINTSCQ